MDNEQAIRLEAENRQLKLRLKHAMLALETLVPILKCEDYSNSATVLEALIRVLKVEV